MKTHIKKLGEEVICDAYVRSSHLNDKEVLKNFCLKALQMGECNIVSNDAILFHVFEGNDSGHGDGVTGLIVIKESHLHVSTWPEESYVQININTCGNVAKPLLALNYLLYELKVVRASLQVLERGVPIPVNLPPFIRVPAEG